MGITNPISDGKMEALRGLGPFPGIAASKQQNQEASLSGSGRVVVMNPEGLRAMGMVWPVHYAYFKQKVFYANFSVFFAGLQN